MLQEYRNENTAGEESEDQTDEFWETEVNDEVRHCTCLRLCVERSRNPDDHELSNL